MKKNFMAIASLLIAAMLLVVSCSQESVIPENNGLVEASLSVGYGRDIKVDHVTDANELTVKYKMTPQWTDDTSDPDTITNPAPDFIALPTNGNLGWITPGYWKVEVKASKGDKDVFSGNVSCYFTKNSNRAVVYLAPVNGETNDCSIEITVSMQEIKETVNSDETPYKLEYEILSGTGSKVVDRTGMAISVNSTETNKIVTYSNTKSELPAGFYTAIVYVVDANNQTVGGIRKGFLLTDGDNATLTGHIEPADYSNVTINAVYVDVNIKLTAGTPSKTTDNKYSVTVKAQDLTSFASIPATKDDFEVTYIWMVNGKVETQTADPTNNGEDFIFTFDNPGYKNIACQAVYKSKSKDTVYFTETDSIYVLVNPTVSQSTGSTT